MESYWTVLEGLGWLLLMLGPFLFVQRWMHREVQLVFLLLTRRQTFALGLFSLVFFGVLPGAAILVLTPRARLLTGPFRMPRLWPGPRGRQRPAQGMGSQAGLA